MITLITGGPGLGKTALALRLLLDEYQDRPLFSNIRGLTLEHSTLPLIKEWTRSELNSQGTQEYFFTFPPNAIIVIDECQHFFRPRASGSAVPPHIQAFETHRHTGVDFILITQGSRLVDTNLRSLVKGGRHIVLRTSFIGRFRYERSEVIDEESKTSIDLASRRKYVIPKEVFPLYKSSELHTKPLKPKLPFQAYILGATFIALAFAGYYASNRYSEINNPSQIHAYSGPVAAPPRTAAVPPSLALAQLPPDPSNHLSAPLYAPLVPEPVLPFVSGCVSSRLKCFCYSPQGAPIPNIPLEQCQRRAEGKYFDPYPPPSQVAQSNEYQQPDMSYSGKLGSSGADGASGDAGSSGDSTSGQSGKSGESGQPGQPG